MVYIMQYAGDSYLVSIPKCSSSYFHLVTFLLEESSSIIFESIIYLFIYIYWIVESISQMWYKCIIRCIFNL